MVDRLLILISFVLSVVLLAMMNFTTPTDVGPLGVLVFFTTLYVVMLGISNVIISIFYKIRGKKKLGTKGYACALILALAPIIILVMRPFVGFSLLSVVVTLTFVGVGWFLVSKVA